MASSSREDDVSFISGDHPSSLLCNIRKCLDQDQYTDIEICVDGTVFKGHKLVLASSSPYFEVMFSGGLSESKQAVVDIHGIDSDTFQILLDFIYTGAISINTDNVQNVLSAADMLQLPEVVGVCCEYLKNQLHSSNSIGIFKLANTLSCEKLAAEAKHFTEENFVDVIKGDEYLDLDLDLLVTLLQSEDLRIETEFQVFEAAINWILLDPKERRQSLVQIVEHIRFPLINPDILFSHIEACSDRTIQIALMTLLAEYNPQKRSSSPRVPFSKYAMNVKPRRRSRKYLMVVGGYKRKKGGRWHDVQSISAVHMYDTYHEDWTVVKGLRYPRSCLSAVCIKDTVYAIGGEQESLLFDNVEKMNIASKKWEDGPDLPTPLGGHCACEVNGLLYVFGGCKGSVVTDDILCMDPAEETWHRVGSMTSRRTNFGLTVVDGLVYIAGGTDASQSDGEGALRIVECFNPVTKEWVFLPNLRHARSLCGLAAVDNTLYAVGGCNAGKRAMTSVEILDLDETLSIIVGSDAISIRKVSHPVGPYVFICVMPACKINISGTLHRWRSVNPMSTARVGASVVAVDRILYAIGGRTAGNDTSAPVTLSTGECYDSKSGLWRHVKPVPVGRCEAAIVVV